jgi:hypothetical protein
MMVPHGKRIALTALAALLISGTFGGQATAAGKPFSAQINGRVFKATAKNAQALFLQDVVELVAHTRKGHFNRALAIACPALNLTTATLPVTLSSCNGNYQETKVSLHPSVKVWATGDGIEITVESFDGSSIKGTFSGAFETPGQPGGPAAVRNGKFNLALGTS